MRVMGYRAVARCSVVYGLGGAAICYCCCFVNQLGGSTTRTDIGVVGLGIPVRWELVGAAAAAAAVLASRGTERPGVRLLGR